MKCPKCGTSIVKDLPDDYIIIVQGIKCTAKPIPIATIDMQEYKITHAGLMCPVCGHVLLEKKRDKK